MAVDPSLGKGLLAFFFKALYAPKINVIFSLGGLYTEALTEGFSIELMDCCIWMVFGVFTLNFCSSSLLRAKSERSCFFLCICRRSMITGFCLSSSIPEST
jgi:hypothetical protein